MGRHGAYLCPFHYLTSHSLAALKPNNRALLLVHVLLQTVMASHCILLKVVILVELVSLLLFLLDLEAELPKSSLNFLANCIDPRLKRQLLVFLVDVGAAKTGWRDLNQAVLVVDNLVGQRVEFLHEVTHSPHTSDLISDFHWAATSRRVLLLRTQFAQVLVSLQLFDFVCKLGCLINHLVHALLLAVPVGVVHQFQENVHDSALNFVTVSKGVENVPELE